MKMIKKHIIVMNAMPMMRELCKKVKDQQLDMRLVNCEYTLDKSKVILILPQMIALIFANLLKF